MCSFRPVPERWVPRPCVFGKGGYDAADMAAHHGFDEDFVSKSRGVNAVLQASVVPTLRKVREGWGTPCVFDSSKVKSLGPPPRRRRNLVRHPRHSVHLGRPSWWGYS